MMNKNTLRFAGRTAPVLLLLALFASGLQRTWGWQLGQWGAGLSPWTGDLRLDILLVGVVAAAVVCPLSRKRRGTAAFLLALLVGFQAACIAAAWPVAVGRMAQGIDHPAFLFRLHEFFEVFPTALGSYNPWWNAGTEHFIGVTSGAHAFGLLMAPFLLFAPLETAYSAALLFWMAVGLPWIAVLLFRRAGIRWSACFAAGLTLLAFTRAEFLFFWQSGNLGGMVSALLAPSVAALAYRIAVQRRGTWPDVALLGILVWLMCLWTPGVFTAAGLFLGWVCERRRWTRRSVAQILAAGGIAALLLLPWLWTTLFPARGMVSYVATGAREPLGAMLGAGFRQCWRRLLEWHPLVLSFGACAVLYAGPRHLRRWMLPVALVLGAVTCSVGFKRNSQFDRVAIQFAAAMVFPATVLLSQTLKRGVCPRLRKESGTICVVTQIVLPVAFAFLAFGGRVAVAHYANSAGFKLWPANPCVAEFAGWIHDHVPPGGRFAFAGITDCKFEWGKPTYLPILADREMMSDDYYGYPKGLTERNYPPRAYRKSVEDFLFFSCAYGITHWAVTDSRNKRFFDENPYLFELVDYRMLQSTHIYIYRVLPRTDPTRFLRGSGTVAAKENRLDVSISKRTMDSIAKECVNPQKESGTHSGAAGGESVPSSDPPVVLRYNWRDGLRSLTPGATLEPVHVDANLVFIGIRPNGNETVRIGYRPSWHPLRPNFDGSFHH